MTIDLEDFRRRRNNHQKEEEEEEDDIEDLHFINKVLPVAAAHQQQQNDSAVRIRNKFRQQPTTSCDSNNGCSCISNNKSEERVNNQEQQQPPPHQFCGIEETQRSNDLVPSNYLVYLKTWGCSHNNSDSEYMGGLLAAHGFRITTTDYDASSLVLLNSCTVKGPSEQHFKNEIERAQSANKKLVVAGCVPQSDVKLYKKLYSIIGVQQIDRIVEVVEETLKGNRLVFTSAKRNGHRSPGADLNLPKIRKNELIEIVPISTGCLNNCTYCKTKLARGQLASYTIDSIVDRITHVIKHENVREIWLTSEDLGAWGIDLGLTIVDLLQAIVDSLPAHVMLRLGMTNPPYILDHLNEIANILSHPNVYEFLHIPVQSGSDSVLLEMKREYDRRDFERICDFMMEKLPGLTLATDIICGYPTETDSDFNDTMSLVTKYRFPVLFINQFYPRPGTPAAKLKRIPTDVVKSRTRKLNDLFQSYTTLSENKLVGTTQRVLVTEVAHDGVKFVGHNKAYQQVLLDGDRVKGVKKNKNGDGIIMGQWVDVRIVGVGKFSMIGGDAWVAGYNEKRGRISWFLLIMMMVVFILLIFLYHCIW